MLQVGDTLEGKYKILKVIGRGGMSTVYLSINERANKTWAIKAVRKSGVLENVVVRQGLLAELKYLRALQHPNLPCIVDVIEQREQTFIVMDYVEGITLQEHLERSGAFEQNQVLAIGKQLCQVIGYLHEQDPPIIYRDVKPSNIMLKPDGTIVLIDFGTARQRKFEKVEDTICLGTRGYAAPEQFGGMGETDERTDIYGIGATLFHLVTGKNPCEPPYEMHSILKYNSHLSSGLEYVIDKATALDPGKRYQKCQGLLCDLGRVHQLEKGYRAARRKRVQCLMMVASLSIIFVTLGLGTRIYVNAKTRNTYEILLERARSKPNSKEQTQFYQKAIYLSPEKTQGYLELLELYKQDQSFSIKEEGTFLKLLDDVPELKKRDTAYARVSFELGKLYWYYYRNGQDGDRMYGKTSAIPWFNVATKELEGHERQMALIYMEVGRFHKNLQNRIMEGTEGGSYKKYWDKLIQLQTLQGTNQERDEVTTLEPMSFS